MLTKLLFPLGQRQLATQVNHHPVWNAPEPEEDWDSG